MRDLYLSGEAPAFLDATAKKLLAEGRAAFAPLGLERTGVIALDGGMWLFPWVGTVKLGTLALALRTRDLDASVRGVALETPGTSIEAVMAALRAIAAAPPPNPLDLAAAGAMRMVGKYDGCLTDALLLHSYASQRIDAATLPQVAAGTLSPTEPGGPVSLMSPP